ncbi:hypothetical protein BDF22DRAFT_690998 [Syncephalis plumigaleata]|nr:hypothetical protein BDF22DRAFT_690998 [Syncephalis plumigaleata]
MVIRKPRHLVSWCCFIPSVLGVADCVIFINMELGTNHINCRHMIWMFVVGLSISNFCNSLILLHKAYLVLCRARWVIYTTQLSYGVFMLPISYATIIPGTGCAVFYPYFGPWYWIANALPLNLVFSTIFCYIGWKQYSRYGSHAWKRLMKDGIQAMLLVAFCNMFCVLTAITQAVGASSDLCLAIDCILVNMILITQHRGKGTTQSSTRAATENLQSASSQA